MTDPTLTSGVSVLEFRPARALSECAMIRDVKNTPPTTLRQRIRDERLARGLSQARLASLAGVHQVCISQVERGVRPSPASLAKLARALDVPATVDDLYPEGPS